MMKLKIYFLTGLMALALPAGDIFGVQTTVGAGGELRTPITVTQDIQMTLGLISKPSKDIGCTRFIILVNGGGRNLGDCLAISSDPLDNDGHFISGHSRGVFTVSGSPSTDFNLTGVSDDLSGCLAIEGIVFAATGKIPGPFTLDTEGNFTYFVGVLIEITGAANPPGGEFSCNYGLTFAY